MPTKQIAIILTSVLLGGSGCVAAPVSDLSPEQATSLLALSVGSEIVVQPTVLGVGGSMIGWLGVDKEERRITLNKWISGEKADLSWTITTQVETAQSITARQAYDRQYASSPVGVEIPDEPEPVYEQNIVRGSIGSESMADAGTLMLPEAWPEGDGGISSTSLIWLARSQYDELVNTRSTTVSLGLFDASLLRAENATSQLVSVVDAVSGLLDPILGVKESTPEKTTDDHASLLKLVADPEWGDYTLLVDGVKTKVRVVQAKNAFARYRILGNPDNPLILEIQLTPLSQGHLNLLSSEGFAEGFGGYEVTEIHTNP